MIRKLALSMALMFMMPGIAGALGLSNIELNSALNEPLDARINLLGATSEQLEYLQISLGSSEDFKRAGIPRPFVLVSLKFKLVQQENSDAYIQVSSTGSITEPFLNFLLKAEWDSGRILREYTVLLDPPLYIPQRRITAEQPAAPVAQVAAPRIGGTDVPLAHEVHYAGKAPDKSVRRLDSSYAASGSNVVGESETLWSMASRLRPDDSISIQQMMLALFNNNPDAFINNNMNLLKRGAVLEVPESGQLSAMSSSEAIAEINRHHEMWEDYRQSAASSPALQPMGTSSSAGTAGDMDQRQAAETTDGRLELVGQVPEGATDAGLTGSGGSASDAGYSSGQNLDLVNEQLEATRMENADLQQRLSKEEELVELLQRQIEIKDNQLAAMQAMAAEAGMSTDLPVEQIAETGEPVQESVASTEPAEQILAPVVDESATEAVLEATPEQETSTKTEELVIDIAVQDTGASSEAAAAKEEAISEIEVELPPPSNGILDQAEDILTLFIPQSVIASLPGGVITVLAALLLIPLLLIALVMKRKKGDEREELAPLIVGTPESEGLTEFPADEDITDINEAANAQKTVEPDFDDDTPTVVKLAEQEEEAELDNTVGMTPSTAADTRAQASPATQEGDPLEEVNVYLAYEQFDQAEALVKKVIADNPDEVSYKLRLLEVYYSSNNKAAYEAVAQEVYDATGGEGEEWGNTVAMWEAMSPDRSLFEEGGADAGSASGESTSEFVDLTSEEAEKDDGIFDLGEDTVNMTPGGVSDLNEDASLDFDLESTGDMSEEDDGDVLDLTALDSSDDDQDELLDLTAGDDDVLDLTALDSSEDDQDEMLDLTASEDDDDVLDLTTALDSSDDEQDEMLDLTAAEDSEADSLEFAADDTADSNDAGDDDNFELLDMTGSDEGTDADSDLLDVTSTGDISNLRSDMLDMTTGDSDDLLDVTSVGDSEAMDDSDMMDLSDTSEHDTETSAGDEHVLEFDIGASEEGEEQDEVLDLTIDAGDDDAEMLDLTSTAVENDDDLLDISLDMADSDVADGLLDLTAADLEDDDDSMDLSLHGEADDDGVLDLSTAGVEDDDDSMDLSLDGEADDDGVLDLSMAGVEDDDDLIDLDLDMTGSDDSEEMLDLTSASEEDDDDLLDLSLEMDGSDDEEDLLDLTASEESEDDNDDHKLLDLSLDDVDFDAEDSDQGLNADDIFLDTHGNDTVEMPAVKVESMSVADVDSSLDELSQSLDAIEAEVGESLSEAKQQEGNFDFSLDIDEGDDDPMATMQLDASSFATDDDEGIDKTVVLPRSANIDQQTEMEEIDNKLNLARAYIELGDKDGARSILDEVVAEGDDAQKSEAETLLEQLS